MERSGVQFNVRMPQKLREKLNEAASANGRSATAELISRLEQSFDEPEYDADECFAEIFAKLEWLESEMWRTKELTGTYDPNDRD